MCQLKIEKALYIPLRFAWSELAKASQITFSKMLILVNLRSNPLLPERNFTGRPCLGRDVAASVNGEQRSSRCSFPLCLFEYTFKSPKARGRTGSVSSLLICLVNKPAAALLTSDLQLSDNCMGHDASMELLNGTPYLLTITLFVLLLDGPYELTVGSDKGLKVGEVFTVDIGESIQFDCSADSNPPNTFLWIQWIENSTEIINYGPYFKIASDKVVQKTVDYMCRAYNHITGKHDETQLTVIYASTDPQKLLQNVSTYPLAAITGISLFIILFICLLFVWKKYQYQLFRAVQWKIPHNR
ncbi:hypothetical protein XELAEV_18032967mg [Xenopus laevis]|uniref:Ig-like domain-containing protein n=1 Tax=Xenopus laevis TaxID=8355 RepID=A0A974CIP6_XENLA|nr:hypothetical protein XELAEV_18032967mg [Xenopus laevis]